VQMRASMSHRTQRSLEVENTKREDVPRLAHRHACFRTNKQHHAHNRNHLQGGPTSTWSKPLMPCCPHSAVFGERTATQFVQRRHVRVSTFAMVCGGTWRLRQASPVGHSVAVARRGAGQRGM